MRAEIVAVGSELLLGEGVDTNSAWLSTRLAEIGVDVHRHITVGDNVARMVAVLQEAAGRAEAVLVTGGLGPTQDDLTRVAVARAAGVELERREELVNYLREYFARGGRGMPESNLVQADLPVGATTLPAVGTAPGFAMELGACVVSCMPGVPREMRAMAERDVLPALQRRAGSATTVSRVVRTAGMSESGVAERCADLVKHLDAAGNPTIAFLASRGETRVRVTGKAADRPAALALVDPVISEVVDLLGTGVAGVDDEGVEHAIARQLQRSGRTLGLAESMTGGGVGARLVTVPGASAWLRGGLVTYATATKTELAGVDPEVLAEHGPVSEPTAAALAASARERLTADVGLAVVGVAGPEAQGGQDVGTICLAVALGEHEPATRTVRLPGRERGFVQEFAASAALDFLRRCLAEIFQPGW
ncbi:MAG: competence/damage-inducible protein A [Egibacteraceae bacterium]